MALSIIEGNIVADNSKSSAREAQLPFEHPIWIAH